MVLKGPNKEVGPHLISSRQRFLLLLDPPPPFLLHPQIKALTAVQKCVLYFSCYQLISVADGNASQTLPRSQFR